MNREQLVETSCEVMHDAYERAAIGAGWETNPASRKPWADVPEANKVTMRTAVAALLDAILPQVTTVEALPTGSILVDSEGSVFSTMQESALLHCLWYEREPAWNGHAVEAGYVLNLLTPLTVVWQP